MKELQQNNATVIAYDPLAIDNFKELFPNIEYTDSAKDVLERTDYIIIQTEWDEFEELDYSGKIVVDGRRIKNAEKTAKIYEGICW